MIVYNEKNASCNVDIINTEVFLRVGLERNQDFRYSAHVTPIIWAPGPLNAEADFLTMLITNHVAAAQCLKKAGYSRCVIGADNDGYLQKLLSPRFKTQDIHERMTALVAIYQEVSKVITDTWVALTIEELAPGGFDATDGISVAQKLENLGLKNLIISSGTRDFLPLYERRFTKKKRPEHEDFDSREPALSSSLWVLEHTNLAIWVLAFFQDYARAHELAKKIGVSGIIQKAL
jgi:2,4-dienoyl-CoA reductase-like NADH-dependent reductase (Old Yellow Enzyme family)